MNSKSYNKQKKADTIQECKYSRFYDLKPFKKVFMCLVGPGIDFPLVMSLRQAEGDEAISSRVEEQQGSSPEAYSPFTLHASRSTNNYFYFLNGQGDVTYFSDANFTPEQVESYEYSPWGVLLTSASKNNLLYTAREFDFEMGLYYFRYRYANLIIGLFNYKDKAFGLKVFIFLENDPLNFFDPFGLSIWSCIKYFLTGGLCTHKTFSECSDCCFYEMEHNILACNCPTRNENCEKAATSRYWDCVARCRSLYDRGGQK